MSTTDPSVTPEPTTDPTTSPEPTTPEQPAEQPTDPKHPHLPHRKDDEQEESEQ